MIEKFYIDISLPMSHAETAIISYRRLISEDDKWTENDVFLKEVLFIAYEQRKSQTEIINAMPLYPTENALWDENQIPSVHYTGIPSISFDIMKAMYIFLS